MKVYQKGHFKRSVLPDILVQLIADLHFHTGSRVRQGELLSERFCTKVTERRDGPRLDDNDDDGTGKAGRPTVVTCC